MITHTRAGRAGLFFAGITGVALGLLSVQARAEQASTPAKDPNEILFEKGMKALRDDRLVSAIEAFRTILSNAPDLHRARLELALAYYRSLAYEKARKAAERVLKDPTVPPNVRVTVLAFLAQVKEDQKRLSVKNHFTPSISFGLMYDSNVNIGPISDVVQIGNQSLVIAPGSRPKSDSATVFSAGLVHRYQPGKRFRAGQRVGQFLWQSEVDLYHRAYFSEHDYNLSVLSASTGPAWVVPRHWRASVDARLDYVWLGGTGLALFSSLNPTLTWQLPDAELSLDATVMNRSYRDDRSTLAGGNGGHNGVYKRAGASYARYFNDRKVAVQGGVDWYDFNAHDDQFGYTGPGAHLAAFVHAWSGGTLFARLGYKDLNYDGMDTTGVVRDEQERRALAGFRHVFSGGHLDRWALKGSFEYTRNRSNDAVYDYRRRVATLTLSRDF